METVQEVDEPKESPPICPDGSPGGLPLTSISSSSASPNSVKLNQNYIDKHQKDQNNMDSVNQQSSIQANSNNSNIITDISNTTTEERNITNVVEPKPIDDNSSNNKIDHDDVEIDVTTPLLNGKNSTNVTSNDFSISEKHALLESSN